MRRTLIAVITLLLAMSVYAVIFGSWMATEIVDRTSFVESALESFERDGSYEAIGSIVARRIVEEYPAAGILEETLRPLLTTLLATEPFRPLLETVAVDIHVRLLDGVTTAVVVDLAAYEEVIVRAVEVIAPGLVDLFPDDVFRSYVLFDAGEVPDIRAEVDVLRAVLWIGVVAIVVLGVILVSVARSRSTVLIAAGLALLLAAGAAVVLTPLGRSYPDAISNPDYSVLASNMYDTVTISLIQRSMLVGAVGAAILVVGLTLRLRRRGDTSAQVQ